MQKVQIHIPLHLHIYHYIKHFGSGTIFSDLIIVFHCLLKLTLNNKIELLSFIMICSTVVHFFMPFVFSIT